MGSGYNVRFGLNYVDYLDNLKRHPTKSAKWLCSFLKESKSKDLIMILVMKPNLLLRFFLGGLCCYALHGSLLVYKNRY
jgi:hypothetical protein